MFNPFKKKKKTRAFGSENAENYIPSTLPANAEPGHPDLSTFITSGYTLLDPEFLERAHRDCEEKIKELIDTCDSYTVGNVCDAIVEGQMSILRDLQEQEEAMRDLSARHILSSRAVRKAELEQRIPLAESRIEGLERQIEPLRGVRAKYTLHLGPVRIPLGVPITIAAGVVDALVNKSFLEGVLLQHRVMLLITVVCMSVMSDGSMFVLGTLLSNRDEKDDHRLRRIFMGGMLAMFLLSIAAGIMIRFGSMETTFGTINASGEFVGKDSYSLAEWGVCVATAFLTTATGLISLVFSTDPDAQLEDRRLQLEAQLKKERKLCQSLRNELHAIEQAVDPVAHDQLCRQAARANLAALETSLKLHIRKLLAVRQQDSAYTDSIADSCEALIRSANNTDNPNAVSGSPEDESLQDEAEAVPSMPWKEVI